MHRIGRSRGTRNTLLWRPQSLRMSVNSIDSSSVPTKILRTPLHRSTLPDLITVKDQMTIAPRGLPYPDTKTEPVIQLCFLRRRHLEQDALKEITHLDVVDPALKPLESCVTVPADKETVEKPAAVPEYPRVHRMQHRKVVTKTLTRK